ncbi:alpha-L-fucosidase [Haladaptatus sp. CMAA 1911]|uniref:alpha-L-fucosidase n=1 Tax=unclassified Haladaptatus TaxID=2622732 RepID=UPI0037550BA5
MSTNDAEESSRNEQTDHEEHSIDINDINDEQQDRKSLKASRRRFLAASGALTLATAFGVGTVAGQSEMNQSAPKSFEEFQSVIDDTLENAQSVIDQGPYEPTRDSLKNVDQVPEWFRDDKFGIYFHWGPYSVPAYGSEWYPRHMYDTNNYMYDHHLEAYGSPKDYPYQKLVQQFTGQIFDAQEWADLFVQAGARFAGPIAEHHDGWSNWDSAINPWNASDRGPQTDITGKLESAIRNEGLHFITSFHHARNGLPWDEGDFSYIDPAGEVGHYSHAYENFPSVTEGWPERAMYANMSTELFLESWEAKLLEVISQYQPDLIWFDNAVETVPDEYAYNFLAYYYNQAAENDQDVAVTRKQEDLPSSMSIEDFEKGRPRTMQDQAWLTDTTLSFGSWSYTEDQTYKSVDQVIHTLIDIVSKNGQMLLNISPKANGTIPDVQRERLLGVGGWLETNGDAVYETRPWKVFGEGPTRLDSGGHFVGSVEYTQKDVRYTQSKNGETLYATVLGWPEKEELTLDAVKVEKYSGPEKSNNSDSGQVPPHAGASEVTLLGYRAVDFSVDDANKQVTIDIPDLSESERPSKHAIAFEFKGFELEAQPGDLAITPSDITVENDGSGVLNISATVNNDGYSTTEKSSLQFFETSGEDQTQLASKTIESIQPQESFTVDFDWEIGSQSEGIYEITAVIDSEDSEENNTAAKIIPLPIMNLAGEWRFHRGDNTDWKQSSIDESDWEVVTVPANWEDHSDYTENPAYGWYRKSITIPSKWKGYDLHIPLGKIDDVDETFFNGVKIGQSGTFPENGDETAWEETRQYTVDREDVNFGGENTIAIRVYDSNGDGGFYDGPLGPITVNADSPPPVVGDSRPQDLDRDGHYEDINGDGKANYDDIVDLFNNSEKDAVQDNVDAFDFNENGRFDFDDIVALFKNL